MSFLTMSGRDGEHLALSSFPTMDIELMFRSRGHVFVWSSTSLLQSDSKWTRMVRALSYDYFCVRHAFMPFSSGLASMQNRASTFWLLWEFLWHVFCIFCNRFVYLALLYPLGPALQLSKRDVTFNYKINQNTIAYMQLVYWAIWLFRNIEEWYKSLFIIILI